MSVTVVDVGPRRILLLRLELIRGHNFLQYLFTWYKNDTNLVNLVEIKWVRLIEKIDPTNQAYEMGWVRILYLNFPNQFNL